MGRNVRTDYGFHNGDYRTEPYRLEDDEQDVSRQQYDGYGCDDDKELGTGYHEYESDSDGEPDLEEDEIINADILIEATEYFKGESREEVIERFTRLVEMYKSGDDLKQAAAIEEACSYLKGFAMKIARRKFWTYLEKDHTYLDDLMSVANIGIIKGFETYNPQQSLPTTWFGLYIHHEMVSETNRMKHEIKSQKAAVKNKILEIKKKYQERGVEPTEADYAFELDLSLSLIKNTLEELKNNTIKKNIDDEGMVEKIPGDPDRDSYFDTPENIVSRRFAEEFVFKKMKVLFSEKEEQIFMLYLRGEKYQEIATMLGEAEDKIRRIVESCRNSLKYDSEIRALWGDRINGDDVMLARVDILPLEAAESNMDILENFFEFNSEELLTDVYPVEDDFQLIKN